MRRLVIVLVLLVVAGCGLDEKRLTDAEAEYCRGPQSGEQMIAVGEDMGIDLGEPVADAQAALDAERSAGADVATARARFFEVLEEHPRYVEVCRALYLGR